MAGEGGQRDATEAGQLLPAHVYARERNWPKYFDTMANLPARPTLMKALEHFDREGGTARRAIDLGCGEGRDTVELLRRGWSVVAVDASRDGLQRVMARVRATDDADALARLELVERSFEDAGELGLPSADLVNASFALPFCAPGAFGALWGRIVKSLSQGGRFAGQFFGDRDEWAALPDRTHHTRPDVMALLEPGFEIEFLEEDEREPTPGAKVGKRWHVFHVVARRV